MIASFFQRLEQYGVRYLLISGQATILYGAATFSEDVDIWVEPDNDNIQRFVQALRDAQARYYKLTPALDAELRWALDHVFGFTELRAVVAERPQAFAALAASIPEPIGSGVAVLAAVEIWRSTPRTPLTLGSTRAQHRYAQRIDGTGGRSSMNCANSGRRVSSCQKARPFDGRSTLVVRNPKSHLPRACGAEQLGTGLSPRLGGKVRFPAAGSKAQLAPDSTISLRAFLTNHKCTNHAVCALHLSP